MSSPQSALTVTDREYLTRAAGDYAAEWLTAGAGSDFDFVTADAFITWYLEACESEPDPKYWPRMVYDTWQRFTVSRATTPCRICGHSHDAPASDTDECLQCGCTP